MIEPYQDDEPDAGDDEPPIPLEVEFPELWGHEPEEPNPYHGTYSED